MVQAGTCGYYYCDYLVKYLVNSYLVTIIQAERSSFIICDIPQPPSSRMGLSVSHLLSGLYGKKEMRMSVIEDRLSWARESPSQWIQVCSQVQAQALSSFIVN
jgi:hypothetical protein